MQSKPMNYDFSFSSYHQDDTAHHRMNQLNKQRRQLIEAKVKQLGYVELKCDYFGTDSYYYDNVNHIMYKVSNVCDFTGDVNPLFEISTDPHIFRLNNM